MIKSSRRAAIVVAASAIVVTASMLPAQAATTGWRVNAELSAGGSQTVLWGVDAVSARDAWATGVAQNSKALTFAPVLRHWTGAGWHPVTLPAGVAKAWNNTYPTFTQIAASSAADVWVFNGLPRAPAYLHLSGTHWSIGQLPGGTSAENAIEVTAVRDVGTGNVWAFGARVNLASQAAQAVPYAAHFNGRTWTGQTLPGHGAITAVSAVSASSVWAVVGLPNAGISPGLIGGVTKPLVLHWTTKAGWQQAAVQPVLPAGANLTSVLAAPDGTVWIGGSVANGAKGTTAFAAKWTPAAPAWTIVRLGGPSGGTWELVGMAPDGHGGSWGVALATNVKFQPSRLWHLSGATWSRVTPNFGRQVWILTQLAAVPGTASVWGVGAVKAGNAMNGLIAVDGPVPG